jgi:diguanylate cyclase (GGDEF)-like protein/PAS domain S-box-containing protein
MDTQNNQNQLMDSDQVHHILVIEDPSFVREIQLDAATYSIGRHSSNDIVLSCQKTSRNHATLLRRTDLKTNQCSYWVLDGDLQGNRSRNGIYVNGKKSLVHELHSGDVVHFSGDASVKYKITSEPLDCNLQADYLESHSIAPVAVNAISNVVNRDALINKETYVAAHQETTYKSDKPIQPYEQNYLVEFSPYPIFEIDLYGNITYINSAGIISFKDIHHRKLSHPLLKDLITQYHQGHDNIITREITINEQTFQQTAHYLPEKRVIRNYITDISYQKNIQIELQQVKSFSDFVVQQISEGVILVESATKQIIEANAASAHLLGYSQDELLQLNIYELVQDSEKLALVLRTMIDEKNGFEGEFLLRHKNSSLIKSQIQTSIIESGTEAKICLIIRSLSGISLSGIISGQSTAEYKRNLYNQQLLTAIANAKRSQKLLAVMVCKLDFTPDITATIGVENRDRLRSALEDRLSTCLRAGDTVVRWQEDKFALLLPQVNDIEEVVKINQRISQSINQSFTLGKTQTSINSATGIAIYPQDGNDPEILLASANTALENARDHQNTYQFYDDAMNSQASVAVELEELLQQAIEKEEFELYYQPQINLDSGKVEAIEALLRWQHPELGLVAPGNFIRLAEKTKLIVPIGEWTIRTACSQNKQWQDQQLPSSKITVSLSLIQFQQPNLAQTIAKILAETNFDASLLELEISAATLMDNIDYSKHLINQLKALGVKIAVDGFTTGFLALEYLKQIPLDTLKIDRSLVQQLTDSPQDLAIVTALIELAKGFNLRVVAEGVETAEQVELLRSLECHNMQGFWFGRPLAANEASKLLELNDSEEAMSNQDTEILESNEEPEPDNFSFSEEE